MRPIAVFLLAAASLSGQVALRWATLLGGSGNELAEAVAVDRDGNVLIVGQTTSPNMSVVNGLQASFGGGFGDAFVAKISPNGNEILWSTYLGGSGGEQGKGIGVDPQGNVYVCGATDSPNFPVTAGTIRQPPSATGTPDIFVTKIAADGSRILYSTLVGGSGSDVCQRLRVDQAGSAYVIGAAALDFPTTAGAVQTTVAGSSDGVFFKLNPAGNALAVSTLLGGAGADLPVDFELTSALEPVIAGTTRSDDLPATAGAFQRRFGGGVNDAFVAMLSADGTAIRYLSYIGGQASDEGRGVSLDGFGNVYVAGGTSSRNLPTTANGLLTAFQGGPVDGFLARLPLPGAGAPLAPHVTYIGDQLQNVGLDALVLDRPAAALTESGNRQPTGLDVLFSLSNFASSPMAIDDCPNGVARGVAQAVLNGTFGRLYRLNLDRKTIETDVCLEAADALTLQNGLGGAAIFAGVGLPGATVTENAPQREHGGGSFDMHLGEVSEISDEGGVKITKELRRGSLSNAQPGDEVVFRVTVTNQSTQDARSRFEDRFENLKLINADLGVPFDFRRCTRSSISLPLTCDAGTLRPRHMAIFDMLFEIVAPGPFVNTARLESGGEATVRGEVKVPPTTLEVTKTLVSEAPYTEGSPVRFAIVVKNTGTATAYDVRVIEAFENLSPTFASSCQKRGTGTELECRLGNIAAGRETRQDFIFTAGSAGSATNEATAFAANAPEVTATATLRISGRTKLSITKKLVGDRPNRPLAAGDAFTFEIVVTNVGERPAANLVIVDTAGQPNAVNLMESEDPTVKCSEHRGKPTLSCEKRGLAARESIKIRADMGYNAGDLFNHAQAGASNADTVATGLLLSKDPSGAEKPCNGVIVPAEPGFTGQRLSEEGVLQVVPDAPAVGLNDGQAPFSDIGIVCLTDPSDPMSGYEVTLVFPADLTNPVLPNGALAGLLLRTIDENGELHTFPAMRGSAPNQALFSDIAFGNGSISFGITGALYDARKLPGPSFTATFHTLLTLVQRQASRFSSTIEAAFALRKLAELDSAIEAGETGFELRLVEGFPGAISDFRRPGGPSRVVLDFLGLPDGIPLQRIPECIDSLSSPSFGLRLIEGANAFGRGGTPVQSCDMFQPVLRNGGFSLAYEATGLDDVTLGLHAFNIPLPFDDAVRAFLSFRIGLAPYQQPNGATGPDGRYSQPPFRTVNLEELRTTGLGVSGGAVNAATFQAPPALGGLITIGVNAPGLAAESAMSLPLPESIQGTKVVVLPRLSALGSLREEGGTAAALGNPEQFGGAVAPLLFVSDRQINAQLPWEVDIGSGMLDVFLVRDGQASKVAATPVARYAPGLFSFDFGGGRAVAVNPDGSVAQPEGSFQGALPSRPARRGEAVVLYATGLGPTSPPAATGEASLDAGGGFVRRDTVLTPRVTIGGVEQQVLFSGLSPQFVGVNQINILIREGTPAGDAVPIGIEIGGAASRQDVTVAIAP